MIKKTELNVVGILQSLMKSFCLPDNFLNINWILRDDIQEISRYSKMSVDEISEHMASKDGFGYTCKYNSIHLAHAIINVKARSDKEIHKLYPQDHIGKPIAFEILEIKILDELFYREILELILERLISRLRPISGSYILLFADENEMEMLLALKEIGFTAVGVSRDYFVDRDAFLLKYSVLGKGPL